MKTIKLSVSPWLLNQEQFNCYTPNGDGVVGDYEFKVNDETNRCDYWIVRGGLSSFRQTVYCPPENVIFLLDEVYDERNLSRHFAEQFSALIGVKNDVNHPKFIYSHEFLPWFFPGVDYNRLRYNNTLSDKKKDICLISSDATWLPGHKTRFAFANQLIGHFKDKLDIYGRGFKSFDNKFEILKNYKYSIAIENNILEDYFTEKINECYLSDCLPIYYGCPNIGDYYDAGSMVKIDFRDLTGSIREIEKAIDEKHFDKRNALILAQKEKYFCEYHFPDKLIRLVEHYFKPSDDKKKVTLYSEKMFFPYQEGLNKIKLGSGMIAARLTSDFLASKYASK